MPQLTFDITEAFLSDGAIRLGKRARNFARLALEGRPGRLRNFRCEAFGLSADVRVSLRSGPDLKSDEEPHLQVDVSKFEGAVRPGDRGILRVDEAESTGFLDLVDGARMFVEHMLARADAAFLRRYLGRLQELEDSGQIDHVERPPTTDAEHVPDWPAERSLWSRRRAVGLDLIAESLIRGPMAAKPLMGFVRAMEAGPALEISLVAPDRSEVPLRRVFRGRGVAAVNQNGARLLESSDEVFGEAADVKPLLELVRSALDTYNDPGPR